jgi:rare lipoprotein A (peptidoglycan hydrolase)
MAQAAAITRQQAALFGWVDSIRRRALTAGAAAASKNTRAFVLGAAAALVWISYQTSGQDPSAIKSVRNETILFRQDVQTGIQSEEMDASDDAEDEADAVPSVYGRTVQTVRFFNPLARNTATDGERFSDRKARSKNVASLVATGKAMYRGEGTASWYGSDFHGHKTANGERYDMNGISAAHRTMPLPSYARVTNLDNGRSIIVRVNNRGPYVRHRIIDVSTGAAKALDFYKKGTTHVRVEFVGRAPAEGSDDRMLLATLRTGTPAPVPAEVIVASAKDLPTNDSDEKGLRSKPER